MDEASCAEAGEDFAGVTDWQEAAALAASAGSPLAGMPRGIRVRTSAAKPAGARGGGGGAAEGEGEGEGEGAAHSWKSQLPSRQEVGLLAVFLLASTLMLGLMYARSGGAVYQDVPPGCKQCTQEWWQDFWSWRLNGLETQTAHLQKPPPGMEWEWAPSRNHTDWFGVSYELVDTVVSAYADPELGPLLHVGCGDSPMPELLYNFGFKSAEHIDIAPQIVSTMSARYPSAEWPGMSFSVRDFLAPAEAGGGPPPPLHRFAAVIDKAGIWDWLQDEAASELPRLLSRVRDALLAGPQKGVYIIVTKQTPIQLSETLAAAGAEFTVETSKQLGNAGIAWSYVLQPL